MWQHTVLQDSRGEASLGDRRVLKVEISVIGRKSTGAYPTKVPSSGKEASIATDQWDVGQHGDDRGREIG